MDTLSGLLTAILEHEMDSEIKSYVKIGKTEIYKDPRSLVASLYHHTNFRMSIGLFFM